MLMMIVVVDDDDYSDADDSDADDDHNDADSACSGEMFLFNPSSTTFVKHFLQSGNTVQEASITRADHTAGYCNVTAAIDAVQFKFSSGDIDAGTIKLYGLKDS